MTRSRLGPCVCLVACIACGGSAPAVDSPADLEPTATPDAEVGSEQPSPDATEPAESTPASAGALATKEDIQTVLQLVLEDEELTPFLHLEQPARFPVKIAGNLPPGLTLVKATQPVEIVDVAEAKKKPVIVFTEIDVGPSRASVRYRYDVEAVTGSSTLEKRDGRWVLVRSRITERQELKR